MPLYHQFQEITLDDGLRTLASTHAQRRTEEIVRQFIPRNAPLSAVESNYIGALGEMAVRLYLGLNPILEDNYDNHVVDDGDIEYNSLVYDVKTDAVPESSYLKLSDGTVKNYEPYGCRVFTAKHVHHLYKYTGGLIFCAIKIPNNAKLTKIEGTIRHDIFRNDKALIIGYIKQDLVTRNEPTEFTPPNPSNGSSMRYNSPNYIFHHSDLESLSTIL